MTKPAITRICAASLNLFFCRLSAIAFVRAIAVVFNSAFYHLSNAFDARECGNVYRFIFLPVKNL
jgi:hypothetical protein